MQIIIDVPDRIYKRQGYLNIIDSEILRKALKDGIPLPKGHGDLIDKSELTTVTEIKSEGSECTYVPYSEIENANIIVKADKES